MNEFNGDLDTLIQERIEADTDFQTSLADLSDEDKAQAISTKKQEVLSEEFKTLKEKADKAAKIEELANNYKIRAEKAEKNQKAAGEGTPKNNPSVGDINTKDLYALMEAKVPQDDIDDVKEYATLKGISISEALKSNVVKTILSDKAEQRQTAQASNVSSSKRGTGKIPDDVLLEKASRGELPDNDADMERLIRLRKGYKQ